MTKVLTDSLLRWQLSEILDISGMKTIFVFSQVKTYVRSRQLPAYLLKLVSPYYLSLTELYLTAKQSFFFLMYFRTRVWQCLKRNQSKITNHYQYIIYAGSKSWETSLTSHLNFQPQISSMENIVINTWLLGKQCSGTTAWSQREEFDYCLCSASYQSKRKARGFHLPWQHFVLHFFWCRALHKLQTTEDWSLGSSSPFSPWPLAPGLLPPSSECCWLDLAAHGIEALECLRFSFRHNKDYKL